MTDTEAEAAIIEAWRATVRLQKVPFKVLVANMAELESIKLAAEEALSLARQLYFKNFRDETNV